MEEAHALQKSVAWKNDIQSGGSLNLNFEELDYVMYWMLKVVSFTVMWLLGTKFDRVFSHSLHILWAFLIMI